MVCELYLRNPWQVKMKSNHFALGFILLFKGLHLHWKIFRDLWIETVENHWPENIFPCFQRTSKTELAEHFSVVMLVVFPSYPPILLMDHMICN